MRNTPISETALVSKFVEGLTRLLPDGWRIEATSSGDGSGDGDGYGDGWGDGRGDGSGRPKRWRPDAVAEVTSPDGTTGRLLIEVKQQSSPRVIDQVRAAYGAGLRIDPAVVVTSFAGRRIREILTEAGIGYFDTTGNIRVSLDRPALFVATTGSERDPNVEPKPLRSLKGSAAGRVVRALCDFKPPYGIRDLGERSNIPAPTVSRVVDLLDKDALVERETRGPVVRADPAPIIRRWVQDYGLTKSNGTAAYLAPRGVPWLRERLVAWNGRYAATASLAVPDTLRVAPAMLAVIYVDSFADAAAALDLREVDAGTNVLLVESFGRMAMERTRMMDGLRCAALSQTAADLLTSPGRGPSEGEELLEWMEGNQDAWRT